MEKRAVIYIRVSDPSQIDNNSLETQEKVCRKNAELKGYQIIKVFSEKGKSAKHINTRPELRKMFEFCFDKKNRISAVFVYKSDRFSRNALEGLAAIARLAKSKVEVFSVIEGYENNAMGRAMRTMVMAMDQLDNELKGERVRDNMIAVYRKGLWPFKCPIGYRRKFKTKEENKGLAPIQDPDLTPIIKDMFEKAAEGIYSKAQLARIMNLAGFGNYYTNEADHKTVNKILEKTFYYGYMYAPKWDEYQWGKHEPIVDKLTWDKAHQKVIMKRKKLTYQDDILYPLKGTLKCSLCKEVMTTSPSRGRNGKVYYYECKNKKSCRKTRIVASRAHKQFIEILQNIQPSSRVLKLFNHMVFIEWDRIIKQAKGSAKKVNQQIEKLKNELTSIRKSKDERIYTVEEAKEQVENVRQELTVLEIERSDIKFEQYDAEIVRDFTKHFLRNLVRLWDLLDLAKKQELQKKIFVGGLICIDNRKIRTPELSPSFELIGRLASQNGKNVTPPGVEPGFLG